MDLNQIEEDTEEDSSRVELRAPTTDWSRYVGYKTVQYIKMGHAPKISSQEEWDTTTTVRQADKRFSQLT